MNTTTRMSTRVVIACLLAASIVMVSTPLAIFGQLMVCPSGCTYSLPSAAYNAAKAGDVIQIQPGTYTDCIYIQKANLTIMGINGMPKMQNKICGGKGILVTAARNLTIKNLELAGVSNSENAAGIRHDAAGFDLLLDNVYIHDNDEGLLSSSTGDTVTILNSRFTNNGFNAGSGMAHNMYFARSALVVFRNSQSTAAKLGGHEFKSRAVRTEIIDSVIAGLDGVDSRLIDISNGGVLLVQNSVLEKGPNAKNTDMIAFGAEGINAANPQSVTIINNKIIGDRSTKPVLILYFGNQPTVTITGNTLVAMSTSTTYDPSNIVYATRAAAGYQAYPWLPSIGPATPIYSSSTGSVSQSSSSTGTTVRSSSSSTGSSNAPSSSSSSSTIVRSSSSSSTGSVKSSSTASTVSSSTVASSTAASSSAPVSSTGRAVSSTGKGTFTGRGSSGPLSPLPPTSSFSASPVEGGEPESSSGSVSNLEGTSSAVSIVAASYITILSIVLATILTL